MNLDPPHGWTQNTSEPKTWFKRFEFDEYGKLRAFLDSLAALAEETQLHPDNIGFGRDYVNITIETAETTEENKKLADFARRLDELSKGM
ncbi:4a-hydroxytetrahydrobiopterin dehydratase [Acidihalobacter prosperus]